MSFEQFAQAIVSGALGEIAQHWNAARGSRAMPGWNDIRPAKISRHLSILWSWRYDRPTDSFTGRLAGDAIEAIFGKSFRGTAMTDLFDPSEYPAIFARHRRVVTEPCFFRGHGVVFRHLSRYGRGERIIMPLADNGADGDGILGATVYQSIMGTIADDRAAGAEQEEWFGLA
jgi:hypothetical protein